MFGYKFSLLYGCSRSDVDIVGKLIERGAQLDAQTFSGKTALHIAVLKRLNECSSLLIKSGCSVNIQVHTFYFKISFYPILILFYLIRIYKVKLLFISLCIRKETELGR